MVGTSINSFLTGGTIILVKASSSKDQDQSKTRSKEAADPQDSVLMSVFSIKPMLSSLPFSRASSAALSHSAMESRWLTDVIQQNDG